MYNVTLIMFLDLYLYFFCFIKPLSAVHLFSMCVLKIKLSYLGVFLTAVLVHEQEKKTTCDKVFVLQFILFFLIGWRVQ